MKKKNFPNCQKFCDKSSTSETFIQNFMSFIDNAAPFSQKCKVLLQNWGKNGKKS